MLKLLALLLVAAFVGLFFVNGPNGEPILTLEDMVSTKPEATSSVPEVTKVYKRKDENGVWQFSSQPFDDDEGDGSNVETFELDGNINTMPAFVAPPQTTQGASQTAKASVPDMSTIPAGLTSVSPEKITEMMNTVNNLQTTVDQRKDDIDSLTGNN